MPRNFDPAFTKTRNFDGPLRGAQHRFAQHRPDTYRNHATPDRTQTESRNTDRTQTESRNTEEDDIQNHATQTGRRQNRTTQTGRRQNHATQTGRRTESRNPDGTPTDRGSHLHASMSRFCSGAQGISADLASQMRPRHVRVNGPGADRLPAPFNTKPTRGAPSGAGSDFFPLRQGYGGQVRPRLR
jgi:hypothetical protein